MQGNKRYDPRARQVSKPQRQRQKRARGLFWLEEARESHGLSMPVQPASRNLPTALSAAHHAGNRRCGGVSGATGRQARRQTGRQAGRRAGGAGREGDLTLTPNVAEPVTVTSNPARPPDRTEPTVMGACAEAPVRSLRTIRQLPNMACTKFPFHHRALPTRRPWSVVSSPEAPSESGARPQPTAGGRMADGAGKARASRILARGREGNGLEGIEGVKEERKTRQASDSAKHNEGVRINAPVQAPLRKRGRPQAGERGGSVSVGSVWRAGRASRMAFSRQRCKRLRDDCAWVSDMPGLVCMYMSQKKGWSLLVGGRQTRAVGMEGEKGGNPHHRIP